MCVGGVGGDEEGGGCREKNIYVGVCMLHARALMQCVCGGDRFKTNKTI